MKSNATTQRVRLTALLIAPDKQLSRQFLDRVPEAHAFQIAAEIKTYPNRKTLEIRLEQVRPDVLLIDLASNLEAACDVIREAAACAPGCRIAGLHWTNDSEAILKSLRVGATEFLHAPFGPDSQREAADRIERLLRPSAETKTAGRVIAFTSAKEGSGATTMTLETAFALKALTHQRILAADLDFSGGTLGFLTEATEKASSAVAIGQAGAGGADWAELAHECGGVSVLAAPHCPLAEPVEMDRFDAFVESARDTFDWILLDLPPALEPFSLLVLSEADQAFLVATPELPSLHLARKVVTALHQLGFPDTRFRLVLNRIDRRGQTNLADVGKLFPCPVQARIPNDSLALQGALMQRSAARGETELGKAAAALAASLVEDQRKCAAGTAMVH